MLFRMIVDGVVHSSSALRSRSMQILAHLLQQDKENLAAVEGVSKELVRVFSVWS